MRAKIKFMGITTVLILFCLFGGIGIAALVDRPLGRQAVYNALEKGFYLSTEDGVWIRPGLNLKILNVSIPADRKPVITYRITDDKGQALDREGNFTPGIVSTSFILAFTWASIHT